MHLSRVGLNPRCRGAIQDLGSPYAIHVRVEALTAGKRPGAPRVLYRLEPESHGSGWPTLLLQSPDEPRWDALPSGYGAVQSRCMDDFLAGLRAGQRFRFRLRANPVRRDDDGCAVLGGQAERLAWLLRRSDACGFMIPEDSEGWRDVAIASLPSLNIRPPARAAWPIHVALFDGTLVVREADAFRAAVLDGIGRSKAFGCGLLSLARP